MGAQDVGDFRCPPRKKVFSPAFGWVESTELIATALQFRLLRVNNDNSLALDDPLADALKNLIGRAYDESIPFWLIVKNATTSTKTIRVYTLISDLPMDDVYDDNDRVLWEQGDNIFSNLRRFKQTHGGLEGLVEHSYTVPAGQTIYRGILVNMQKSVDQTRYYPVGLFSAQAAQHFQLDPKDILAIGLVHGSPK